MQPVTNHEIVKLQTHLGCLIKWLNVQPITRPTLQLIQKHIKNLEYALRDEAIWEEQDKKTEAK